jgi:hypothetical protein
VSLKLIKSTKYIGDNPQRKHRKFVHLHPRLNRKYGMIDEKQERKKKKERKEKGQDLERNTYSILHIVYTTLNRK